MNNRMLAKVDRNSVDRSQINTLTGRTPDFVELLARSNFSFLMGASHPDEMVLLAKPLGYRGLSICDVNGLYGVVRGYQAANKPSHFDTELSLSEVHSPTAEPFRYHIGAELTPFDSSSIALLPMSHEGYSCLSRLLTHVKRPAAKGRIQLSFNELIEQAGGKSGALSIAELIAVPLPPWNYKHIARLQEAFGDRLYIPVCRDMTWESLQIENEAFAYEKKFGVQLFATQRPLFHRPERKPLHDVLTCLLHKTTLTEAKTRLLQNAERHLKTLQELKTLYQDRPDLLVQTVAISDRLQFQLSELRYKYPREAIPSGLNSTQFLRQLVEEGMKRRCITQSDAARKQVEHELSLIQELEYEDYFLTLWDICQFAQERNILHQGRGSAANSIVCFVLGLTAIDPIKVGLLFERFLSRERAEPPDIDIDFEHERREEVIQYIYQKYGAEHAAMVCTTICYRSRMAIRDVAKVFGTDSMIIDKIVKHMGREGLTKLNDCAESKTIDFSAFGMSEAHFRFILKMALELKGFPRHLGIHTGGFVISHLPIVDIVPVEAATMTERYVIQWNKDDIQTLGLMKIDVLSLGMLSAIRKSLHLLKQHKCIELDFYTVPHDDEATYKMIQKADTVGVFQIESRAQMSLLPRLKPKNWYDLVVEVAIVRPGPIQGGMVHPYLRRREGLDRITYAHPKLIPILKKTLGIPIFQEQIMQIAVAVAGFTPGEADELRRVVSSAWKKKTVMHGLRQRLINGMLANGLNTQYAEQIYRTIEGFASYGFPEAHAASFALITYVSCWLKQHHPEVFTTSLLNSQPMGFYPPRQLIADAQRHGVHFTPLDVQYSEWDYTLEAPHASQTPHASRHSVRVGMRSIQGMSESEAKIICNAREKSGAFLNIEDLVRRTRLTQKTLSRLAAVGALSSLSSDPRRTLFTLKGLDFNQGSFFYSLEPIAAEDDGRNSIRQETDWEHVVREYRTKGFSLDLHPIKILRTRLKYQMQHETVATDLNRIQNGTNVCLIGLLSMTQKPPTAKGLCFLSLEDETGIFNVVVMPDLYEKIRVLIRETKLIQVRGQLQNRNGVCHIKASALSPALVLLDV